MGMTSGRKIGVVEEAGNASKLWLTTRVAGRHLPQLSSYPGQGYCLTGLRSVGRVVACLPFREGGQVVLPWSHRSRSIDGGAQLEPGSRWYSKLAVEHQPAGELLAPKQHYRHVDVVHYRGIQALVLEALGRACQLDATGQCRQCAQTAGAAGRNREVSGNRRRRMPASHCIGSEVNIDQIEHLLVTPGRGQRWQQEPKRPLVAIETPSGEPVDDEPKIGCQCTRTALDSPPQKAREGLVVYPKSALGRPFSQDGCQRRERLVQSVSEVRPHFCKLGPVDREIEQADDVRYARTGPERDSQVGVVVLQRAVERRKRVKGGLRISLSIRTREDFPAKVSGVKSVTAGPFPEYREEVTGPLLFDDRVRGSGTDDQAQVRRQRAKFRLRQAWDLNIASTSILQRRKVLAGLAQHDQDAASRNVKSGQRRGHRRGRIGAGAGRHDPRDMIKAIDNQGDPTAGLGLHSTCNSAGQRHIIRSVPWPLGFYQARIGFRQMPQRTAEDGLGLDALVALVASVVQIAVVLSNQPADGPAPGRLWGFWSVRALPAPWDCLSSCGSCR